MAPFLKGRTTKSDPFPRACTVYLRAPEVPLRLLRTVCAPCYQPYVQRKGEGAVVTMQRSQKAARDMARFLPSRERLLFRVLWHGAPRGDDVSLHFPFL